jgi:predicted metal-binding membrane protein
MGESMSATCDQNVPIPRSPRLQIGVLAAGLILFVPSAALTIYYCRTMAGGMEMPGGWFMSMTWMRMPGQSWAGAAEMFMVMWTAMMVAMMLPSFFPILHRFHGRWRSGVSTAGMVLGYFTVWSAAGAILYPLGVALNLAAMRWGAVSRAVPFMTGGALIAVGILQFTPWKKRALSRCHGPLSCVGHRNGFREGVHCGLNCVTCCFGPTLALCVLGMMNLLLLIFVTGLITLEKLLPEPKYLTRSAGIAAIAIGVATFVRSIL